MIRNLQDGKVIRFAVCGALATALVACAGSGHLAKASARGDQSPSAKASGKLDRTVADAEERVRRSPRDAAVRATLGNAYLAAGRFESAAATFQDAIALGDSSANTALRLALAQVGIGQNREAVTIVDMHGEGIPASDRGLALALAGETSRGVEVLSDALRAGEDTPKLRQNLAYAFALDGRWLEARLMAAQDVPADQLDARISSWAAKGRPEDHQLRVAGLLGSPVRPDTGRPVELALSDSPAVAPTAFAAAAPADELPASEPAFTDPSREFAVAAPDAVPAPAPALPSAVSSSSFAAAFAETPQTAAQPLRRAPARVRNYDAALAPAAAKPVRGGGHNVQLGSFSSPENAQRAIKIFKSRNPELKNFAMTITPAVVRGKNFWRVSASGFSQASAFGMCSTVRTRGGGCIAYSSLRPLPGGLPARGSGALMARR